MRQYYTALFSKIKIAKRTACHHLFSYFISYSRPTVQLLFLSFQPSPSPLFYPLFSSVYCTPSIPIITTATTTTIRYLITTELGNLSPLHHHQPRCLHHHHHHHHYHSPIPSPQLPHVMSSPLNSTTFHHHHTTTLSPPPPPSPPLPPPQPPHVISSPLNSATFHHYTTTTPSCCRHHHHHTLSHHHSTWQPFTTTTPPRCLHHSPLSMPSNLPFWFIPSVEQYFPPAG